MTQVSKNEAGFQSPGCDSEDPLPGETAEQRLRKTEAMLRKQYQSFPIPTYTWQRLQAEDDFSLIDFNEAAVQLTSPKLVELRFVRASVFFRDKSAIYQNIQHCFAKKTTLHQETDYWYQTISAQRWLKITYVYVEPDLVMVHTEDISEQKLAIRAIEERELRLQLVTDNMHDLILVTDGQGVVTYASPSHSRILGYKPEVLVGKPAARFCHPDDLNSAFAGYWNAVQRKEVFQIECRMLHANGQYLWFETFGNPIYDASGVSTGLIFSSRDINRRKAAEEELSASEFKFRQLAENIREVFWLSDPIKHEMIYTSPAYQELWGVSREGLYQQHSSFMEVVHPEDRPRVQRIIHEELEHPITFEYRVIHPDGSARWLRDRAFPLKDEQGITYRIAGITEDITDLKRTEIALREQSAFEDLILRLSLELIDTDAYRLFPVLEKALGEVGIQIGAEQAFVFFYNHAAQRFERMVHWMKNPDAIPLADAFATFQHAQPIDFKHAVKSLRFYPDIQMAEDAPAKAKLHAQGVKSLLHIPILSSNRFTGMLGFTTQSGYASWQGPTLSLINLFGSIVASTIARRTAEISLLQSYQDLEGKVRERTAELLRINDQLQTEIEQRKQIEAVLREENDFINALFNTTNVLILALDHQDRVVVANHQCEVLTGYSSEEIIGKYIFDLMSCSIDEIIDIRDRYEAYKKGNVSDKWYSENRRILPDGSQHIIAWSGSRIQGLADAKYFSVFLGIDITENRHLQKKLRLSEDRYHRLFLDLPISILEVESREDQAVIINANRRAQETYREVIAITKYYPLEAIFSPTGRDDAAVILHAGLGGKGKTIETTHLRASGETFPVRISVGQDPEPKPARFVLVVEDITAEKARRSEEIAISEERQRIAREIHDGIAQDLASLRIRTNYWKSILKSAPDKLDGEFDFLQQQLGDNIQEVRRSIFALRPLALEKGNFFTAIEKYLREFGEMNGLATHLTLPEGRPALGSDLELTTFRILQEGLNNIAKHAHAENVWISLEDKGCSFSLTIQDDGVGFNTAELLLDQHSEHIGLQQMRIRVQGIHGVFKLTSTANEGTVISVQMPFEIE